ncbi:hypothetical protein [Streptomyces chrestomyceticus]|uniref:hypothetical protein n=1 Tax=Streptomyces chrestomyceticus TaxID=68185 RepID=UPI0004C50503
MDVAIGAVGPPSEDDRKTHVIDISGIGAFLGLDVGKGRKSPHQALSCPVVDGRPASWVCA